MAALLLPDERLVPRKTVGIALGFVGVVVTIGWTALLEIDLRSLAQIAILAATLSYAIASVFARVNLSGVEPSVAAMGMLTGSSLVQIPMAWMLEGPIRLDLHLSTWLAIGYFALFSTALAYLLYYRVLRMAGAGNLMLVTLLIPPIAIFLGAVFLDESLSPSTYLGFAIIGLGLVILDGRLAAKLFHRKSK
jgi:drug/metabolite transporter (DMT)-like permease